MSDRDFDMADVEIEIPHVVGPIVTYGSHCPRDTVRAWPDCEDVAHEHHQTAVAVIHGETLTFCERCGEIPNAKEESMIHGDSS